MSTEFEVIEVQSTSPDPGQRAWGVMQYIDGVPAGIDFHWVREDFAVAALQVYQTAPEMHGHCTSQEILSRSHG